MKKKTYKRRLKDAITFIVSIETVLKNPTLSPRGIESLVSDCHDIITKLSKGLRKSKKKTERIKTEGNPAASKKAWSELTGAPIK